MGEELTFTEAPVISVRLWVRPVHVIRDGRYVYSVGPNSEVADLTWQDAAAEKGRESYYYIRGEQTDGELVW